MKKELVICEKAGKCKDKQIDDDFVCPHSVEHTPNGCCDSLSCFINGHFEQVKCIKSVNK